MAETPGTLELIGHHLTLALRPLRNGLGDLTQFKRLMYRLGWKVTDLPPQYAAVSSAISTAENALETLGDDPSPEDIAALLRAVKAAYFAVEGISTAPAGVDAAQFLAEIGERLFELVLTDYLALKLPGVYSFLLMTNVIRLEHQNATGNRPSNVRVYFDWSQIPNILSNPGQLPHIVYGWGTPDLKTQRIVDHLAELLFSLGLLVEVVSPDSDLAAEYADLSGDPDPTVAKSLNLPFHFATIAGENLQAAFALRDLAASGGKLPGLVLEPQIPQQLPLTFPLSDSADLTIRAGSDVASKFGILIRPGEISITYPFAPGQELPRAGFGLTFDFHPETTTLLLGAPDDSRVEAGGTKLGLHVNYLSGQLEFILSAEIRGMMLVLAAGEGDSFLLDVLGRAEKRIAIPLGIEWSSTRGIHFQGGGGFEVELPSHIELGPILVQAIAIRLYAPPEPEPRVRIQLGANMTGHLGPLTATVQGIGIKADLLFQDGNAGPFDIDLGFRAPDGVGLSVNGGGFTGGGFLSFKEDKGEYAGMLELEFEGRIALKAIGLLNTVLPGSESGFSLIIVITSEFPPIPLGLGFSLIGAGGLIGINRSASVERLRSGVRDGTLDSVLFPADVIANASRILSDLQQVFPPTKGRYIFGPMARIAWGLSSMITIDVGLIIEVPTPVRIVVLGNLRVQVPAEDNSILRLQVNFVGVIDFDAGTISIDASLYESNLLTFTLTGDMAVRVLWAGDAGFLITVGGFHPSFQPPPLGLPALRRITLPLRGGDNPRLTLEVYFARTSNTFQVGAKVELYADAGSFSIAGFLSFDALFQLVPFAFATDVAAMLALRAGSSTIAAISLAFSLSGPTPWRARGEAKLKICWFLTVRKHFDETWGERRTAQLQDVAVLPMLKKELADAPNWVAELPAGKNLLVTLRQIDDDAGLVVSPAGVLTVSQKLVPLDIELQRFGAQRPADANRFTIQQVSAGPVGDTEQLETTPATEDFAPAQFFDRSDNDNLTGKSFERYRAGVRIEASEELHLDYAARRIVSYELFYKDDQRDLTPAGYRHPVDGGLFEGWATGGAVANSPLSHARRARPADAPGEVRVRREDFAVVHLRDLTMVDATALHSSEAEARAFMRDVVRNDPRLAGEIQVVPAFEVSRA